MDRSFELVQKSTDFQTAFGLLLLGYLRDHPEALDGLKSSGAAAPIGRLVSSFAGQEIQRERLLAAIERGAPDEEIFFLIGNCMRRAGQDAGTSIHEGIHPVEKGGPWH